jgi:biopolymer transport protein ExbD
MFKHTLFIFILLGIVKTAFVQQQADLNTYNLIVVKDSVYVYQGTAMADREGFFLNAKSFHNRISKLSKSPNSNKLFIKIKPSENSTYKNIVDVLDEMSLNKIERFSMEKLTSEEEKFFGLESKEHDSGPAITTTTMSYTRPYLLFHLKVNSEIAYLYVDSISTTKEIPIGQSSTKAIFEALNEIEKKYSIDLAKIYMYIKGDATTKFKDFDALIQALKQKDIYKYTLVTD